MRVLQSKTIWGLAREYKSRKKEIPIETPSLIVWDKDISPTENIVGRVSPSNVKVVVPPKWQKNSYANFSELLVYSPKIFPNVPELFPESMKEEMEFYLENLTNMVNQNPETHYIGFIPEQLVTTPYFEKLLKLNPAIVFIRFSFNWKSNSRKFVDIVVSARLKTPNDVALGLGGIIPPYFYGPLAYLGIDVFDGSWIQWVSSQNLLYFKGKEWDANTSFAKRILSNTNLGLYEWNQMQALNEISYVKEIISNFSLRDYVESLIHVDPIITSILRRTSLYQDQFLEYIPITGKQIFCSSELSLNRPEIKAFHKRVIERYSPRETKIVVILPCSYKKPYFVSQSHQRYGKVIRNFYKKVGVFPDKIIITSPMGAVPGDLDIIYPVAHYDIPVTGHWSETEISITAKYFANLLLKYPLDTKFVVHTSDDYKPMVRKGFDLARLKPFSEDYFEKPYSADALNTLSLRLENVRETLLSTTNSLTLSNESPLKQEYIFKLRAMASYQYGRQVGDSLLKIFKNIKVRGKYPRDVAFFSDNEKIGTLSFTTSKVVLSLNAIKLLLKYIENKVWFAGNKITGSSIFVQGIERANKNIRPQDEVVVVSDNEELLAIGTALLPGKLMMLGGSGVAIKIRQKVK